MKLTEALGILKKHKISVINEDTDDWDEADMPAGVTPDGRKDMASWHNYGKRGYGVPNARSLGLKIANAKDYNVGVATTRIKPADVIMPMEKDGWKFLKHQPEDEMDRYYFKKTFRLGLAGRKFEYDVNFAPYYEEDGLQINWETDYASGNENVDSFDDVPLFFDDEADNDIEYEGEDVDESFRSYIKGHSMNERINPALTKGDREQLINSEFFDKGKNKAEINKTLKANHMRKMDDDEDEAPWDDTVGDMHVLQKGLRNEFGWNNIKFTPVNEPELKDMGVIAATFDYDGVNYELWVEDNDYILSRTEDNEIAASGHSIRGFFESLRETGMLKKAEK